MSGIAGIYRADGRAVDPALLLRMTDALAHRGPDGEGHWVDGPVGLGFRSLVTTPEAQREKQPIADAGGQRWIVGDGRLDNRRELIEALGLASEPTDFELVLAAAGVWGCEGFPRLIGDFAFALWDGRTRSLVCARDAIGVKPFYYRWDGRRLLFGSEVKALLTDPTVPKRPDESTIADYLLMGFRDAEATFFAGIKQLPPGHLLRADADGISVSRYWAVDPARAVRYAREEDYFEAFRERFGEAVAGGLRSVWPVGVMLSGGIDSTSVTAMAEVIRRRSADAPALVGFTLLAEGLLDEDRATLERLTNAFGTPIRRIAPETPQGRLTAFEPFLPCAEAPHYEPLLSPLLLGPAVAEGCRVLLTGFGADELSQKAEDGYLADVFRWLRPRHLLREARAATRAYGGTNVRGTLANLAWNELSPGLKRAIKRLAHRQVPAWLDAGFARRAGLHRRVLPAPARAFPTLCQEASYRAITKPSMAFALNQSDALASAVGVECRHPYLNRRVVEFFLALPSDVKLSRGFRKQFVQHALHAVLPGAPRGDESLECAVPFMDRTTVVRTEAGCWARDLFHPRALVFQYVDRAQAERMRDLYVERGVPYRNLLWSFAKLERWLQEWFAR